jgi:amino acid transporter
VAVLLQSGIALLVLLAAGLPMGAFNLFNTLGTTGTFVYIPIFILMNIAAFRFIRTQHPSEFSVAKYVVAPVISTVALALIAYNSLNPLPDMPIRLAPLIALVYLLAGFAVLYGRNLKPGNTDWMARAGQLPDVD